MILLTVIAVGVLSLSSIALRTSSRAEAGASARANAKLALALALADLQRQLGPDSRISAPSDAGTVATGGHPHWTGVYDAWSLALAGVAETPVSRTPSFRGWLVSGMDSVTGLPAAENISRVLLLDPGTLGTASRTDDEIRVPFHPVSIIGQSGNLA